MAENAQLQTLLGTIAKLNQGFQDATKHSQAFNKRIKQAQKKVQGVTSSLNNVIRVAEKLADKISGTSTKGKGKRSKSSVKAGQGVAAKIQKQFNVFGKSSKKTGKNILQVVADVDEKIAKASAAWQQFNGILEQSGIGNTAFGQRILGVVNKINLWKETYGPLVTQTLEFATSVGEALKSVGKIASSIGNLLGSIRKLGGVLGQVGKTVLPIVGKSMRWFGTIFMSVGRALLANPIGLVVGAIAAAAFLIIKYWEPIKAFFLKLWEPIKAVFFSVWNSITGFFSGIWEGIKSLFSGAIGWIMAVFQPILSFFTNLFGGIQSVVGSVFDWFSEKFQWLADKFAWIGKIASKVAGWFGFGKDEEKDQVKEKAEKVSKKTAPAKAIVAKTSAAKTNVEKINKVAPSQAINASEERIASARLFFDESEGGSSPKVALTSIKNTPGSALNLQQKTAAVNPAQTILESAKNALPAAALGVGLAMPALSGDAPRVEPYSPVQAVSSSAPQAAQPSNHVFNIYPSEGMDEQALARMIAQQLEEHERQKAARRSSRLYDTF